MGPPMGLDHVEVVMEIEDTFGVSVPDEEAERLLTVLDVQECVIKLLLAEPERLAERLRPVVFAQVQAIIAEQMAIRPASIKPHSRLVEDIGMG